jgi:hypothetical protein
MVPVLVTRSQFLDTTRRAVPAVAHGGLIGNARTFAAHEEPNLVVLSPIAGPDGRPRRLGSDNRTVRPVRDPWPASGNHGPRRNHSAGV